MAGSRTKKLPASENLADLVEFFEAHDMGDYLDEMPKANFEINLQRRTHLVALDEDLAGELSRLAEARHISSQALLNSLLREKLAEAN